MTAVLPLIAVVVGLLLVAGLGVLIDARRGLLAVAGICGLGALAALFYLAAGAPATVMELPVGPPGVAMTLALDGLSGFFLLLVLLAGAACCLATMEHPPATVGWLPLFVAAMAIALLAGDCFTLVFGFELMSLASFALILTDHADPEVRAAGLLYLGIGLLGAGCLIPALALLGGGDFSVVRAQPPEGMRAAAVLILVLVGAGSKAGLVPLHVWLPPAHASAPAPVSALLSGAMTKVAVYVLIRVLFDLCGPQPGWWGVPLLVLGAGGAVLGGLRAVLEGDLKRVLAGSTIENVGLIAIGLGIALAARAVDLGALAALALGAALLHAMAHGLFKSLLFLAAGAVQYGAGTRRLDRLGGLIHRMPVTAGCVLLGAACLAALPPSSGFAGEWTLFQALLGAPRIGGLGFQTVVAAAAAAMALAAALAAVAGIRLVGVGFLGRPRTPRAAAADEAGPLSRMAMLGLAGVTLLVGLFPGGVLMLAGPALHRLLGAGVARADVMLVAPQRDAPGYAALAIGLLLLAGLAASVALLRRFGAREQRAGSAWDGGFAPPPAWLPFGDPLTQYGAASFAEPLRRVFGRLVFARTMHTPASPGDPGGARFSAAWRDPAQGLFDAAARLRDIASARLDQFSFFTIRGNLMMMFALLVAALAVLAALEQG